MDNKKCDIAIKKYGVDDIKQIGVFISYQHSDKERFLKLCEDLKNNNVNVLGDHLIEPGSQDFCKNINDMIIHSVCGIVLLPKNALLSQWVSFEIGYLKSKGKTVYLYAEDDANIPSWLEGNCEIVRDYEELINRVKKERFFKDLLSYETSAITKAMYNEKILNELGYVSIKIKIPGISAFSNNPYKFSYLIPGLYKCERDADELDRILDKNVCNKNMSSYEECGCSAINDGICPYIDTTIKKDSYEMLILNKIYNSIYVADDYVIYILPVHKRNGTTFKCFIDIFDFTIKNRIVGLLNDAGLENVENSDSASGDRIYFCIPQNRNKSLFKTKNRAGFYNNYLCPGIL